MTHSLAFLPLNRVHEGMDYLKQIRHSDTFDLLAYFDTTYVNGSHKRVGNGTTVRLKKAKPLFLPDIWNVFETTINGEHRTNNICQSCYNWFSHLVEHSHPTMIWV